MKKKFNSFNKARDVGVINRKKNIKGITTRSDKVDFFELDLSNRSSFSIQPKRVRSNLKIQVFDGDRDRITKTKFKAKGKKKSLEQELDAGTYYIRVKGRTRSGKDRFKLKLSANTITDADNSSGSTINDDTLAAATDLGVLSTTVIRSDTIGADDTVDFYKFTLNDIANLDVKADGSTVARRIQLIQDANNNGIVDNGEVFAPTSFSNLDPLDVPPGTYFIKLESFSSESAQYQLTVVPTFFGGNVSPEPGNTLPLASNTLGTLFGSRVLREYVGTLDTNDLYRFTLNDLSNLQVTATASSTPVEVQLILDKNNNGLIDNDEVFASRAGSGLSTPASVTQDLPSGNYFINVEPRFGTTPTSYEMTVVATPYGGNGLPDPGNTLSSARNLGVLSGTSSLKEYVGVVDLDDFYQFTLSNNASLQARLTSASTSLDIMLIQDTNNNGLVDNGETLRSAIASSNPGNLTEDLPAGTYFLQVEPRFTGNFSSNYELDLTITT